MDKKLFNPMAELFKCVSIAMLFLFIGNIFSLKFLPNSFVNMANIFLTVFMVVFLLILMFSKKSVMPRRFSMNIVYLISFINGVLLSPTIRYYIGDLGYIGVINVLLTTVIIFAALSFIACKSDSDKFLKLGPMLAVGLIALLITSLINLLFFGRVMNFFLSAFGALLFSTYILYDISLVKRAIERGYIRERDDLSTYVLGLYVDFVNLFTDLLNIASRLDD